MTDRDAEPVPVALEAQGLSKRYGATQALDDVSIRLELGKVTALAGENGAGKSTLIRLVTGVERPDDGVILRDGIPVNFGSRHDATKAGVFCVYQDQPFVEQFSVAEQIYLGYEDRFRRRGVVSAPAMHATAAELLDELGLGGIQPSQRMGVLSPAAREVVALAGVVGVARLLEVEHPVILLDEPTSALSAEELDFLAEFFRSLESRSALLFVSHRINELLDWSDTLYVLRDGRNADHMDREAAEPDRVYAAMGGPHAGVIDSDSMSSEDDVEPIDSHRSGPGDVRLTVRGLRPRPDAAPTDAVIRAGEIVGLAGVEGSGKETFLRFCAGLDVDNGPSAESFEIDGRPFPRRQRDLLDEGIVYLSGERQRDGVFGKLSIAENIAISRRVVKSDFPLIRWQAEQARAEQLVDSLAIKTAGVTAPLDSLSGGNQQKVLLGRCLELDPRVMLLDNVTRGVDIGAKNATYDLFSDLAAEGVAIVLASDDLDELITVADRLLVFRSGSITKEFPNPDRALRDIDILREMT